MSKQPDGHVEDLWSQNKTSTCGKVGQLTLKVFYENGGGQKYRVYFVWENGNQHLGISINLWLFKYLLMILEP